MGEIIEITKVHLFSILGIGTTFLLDVETAVQIGMTILIGLSVIYYNYHRAQNHKADKELKEKQKELLGKDQK